MVRKCWNSESVTVVYMHWSWFLDVKTGTESFIYPTDAQLDCSKNVKIYIKIYKRGAPTCFSFFTTIIRELLYVLC